jgi:tetratricopeptide (TPR) repeat protein
MKDEQKPTDRFGKQLRSFTDWLKTMKKLPVADISKNISPAAEQNVQKLAEHSLDNREVLTETMAEVWEKQGNHEKAVEIYEKLSLLDPSKSVYFAAKIEGLKKKN